MGGGSGSSSHNSSSTTYSNTTTTNPYVKSKTTNEGTVTQFANNNVLNQLYKQSNKDFLRLYNELVNEMEQAALEKKNKTKNSNKKKTNNRK